MPRSCATPCSTSFRARSFATVRRRERCGRQRASSAAGLRARGAASRFESVRTARAGRRRLRVAPRPSRLDDEQRRETRDAIEVGVERTLVGVDAHDLDRSRKSLARRSSRGDRSCRPAPGAQNSTTTGIGMLDLAPERPRVDRHDAPARRRRWPPPRGREQEAHRERCAACPVVVVLVVIEVPPGVLVRRRVRRHRQRRSPSPAEHCAASD
jgi:hypothetical protein